MRTPEEWGDLAERCGAASKVYGKAKRWALAGLAAYVGMVAAGIALGMVGHSALDWTGRILCIVGAVCMWRSVAFTRRAGKLLKVLP